MWVFPVYRVSRITVTERLDKDFHMFTKVKMHAATASAFSDCSELFAHKLLHFTGAVVIATCFVFAFYSYFPVLDASFVQLLLACSDSDAGNGDLGTATGSLSC